MEPTLPGRETIPETGAVDGLSTRPEVQRDCWSNLGPCWPQERLYRLTSNRYEDQNRSTCSYDAGCPVDVSEIGEGP